MVNTAKNPSEWKVRKPREQTGEDDSKKGFQKGNQLWLTRAKHGRNKKYETAQQIWDAAVKYFEWVVDNPLTEVKLFHHQGKVEPHDADKMRPMHIKHFCFSIGICESTWHTYRTSDIFKNVCEAIEAVIFSYNLDGGASGLMDPGIIARLIGLKEIKDIQSSDGSMTPKEKSPFDLSLVSTEDLLLLERLSKKYSDGSDTESE